MNTRDRQEDLDDQFETMLRNGLDRLAAQTPTTTPQGFDPDDVPITTLTTPEARRWTPYLVTAAAATIVAVGLVTVEGRDDPQTSTASPAASPPPNASEPATSPSTLIDVTTTVLDSPELIPGSSAAPASTTPNCAITGAQALVPNVAGMPWVDAAAVLATAGLEPNALPELPPPLETPDADYYVIIRQGTAPGTTTSCGTLIDITVAYRPGILYIVQEGDTYESIATSQGITLEQLLGFNGLTVAELELAGQDPTAPLTLGQALRLSNSPATLTVPTTTSTP